MTRTSATRSSQPKPQGPTAPVGREQGHEDERPFAEIRRNVYDVLRLLSQHRWLFFVPFCIVTCGAFIASFYYPRTYSATTSFEVRNDPIMINLPMSAGAASYKYFRNTMTRDLTAQETMTDVVEAMGLHESFPRDEEGKLTTESIRRRDSLARSLGANLSITTTSPSELIDIVKITYTGPDASIGRKLVDQVKRTYIRRTTNWIKEYLGAQRDYFVRESNDAGEELLAAQRAETKLRMDNPNVDPTDPGSISVKLSQLELERRELQARKRDFETELAAQQQLLAETHLPLSASAMTPLLDVAVSQPLSQKSMLIAAQVSEIKQSMAKLRETRGMTDAHPEMQHMLAMRLRLESQLEEQRTLDAASPANTAPSFDSPPVASVPETARKNVYINALGQKIKDAEIALQTNEGAIALLAKAKEEVYEKQEEFSAVLGRVTKARHRQAQADSTVGMIEPALKAVEQERFVQFSEGAPARGAITPISPKATTVVLLSLLAGVAAGAVFVILGELFDNIFRSSGQVGRTLGLPILEAIDEIVTVNDRRKLLVYHAVLAPVVVAICLGLTTLTASMAYLSLTQPWTYNKIKAIPQSALDLFIDRAKAPPLTPVAEVSPKSQTH